MANRFLVLSTLFVLNHEVLSQILTQPIGLLNQPITEPRKYIQQLESPRQYIQQLESPRQYIQQYESPRYIAQQQIIEPYHIIPTPNSPINIPNAPYNIPSSPIDIPNFPVNIPNAPTTLITDCSPSVCKNIANTIQLMILSSLLQSNNVEDEIALQLAPPRSSYSIGPSFVSPKLGSPNFVAPAQTPSFVPSATPNNILSSVSSNGQIERGLLSNMLKLLGGGV